MLRGLTAPSIAALVQEHQATLREEVAAVEREWAEDCGSATLGACVAAYAELARIAQAWETGRTGQSPPGVEPRTWRPSPAIGT
jgi:hypothetical protein